VQFRSRTHTHTVIEDIDRVFNAMQPVPVFVSWFVTTAGHIYISVVKPNQAPVNERLPMSLNEVHEFVKMNLDRRNFKVTLLTYPELLDALSVLIAPLAWLTNPEEPLILCPTASLYAVPMHALDLMGAPLIVRNPVSYTPSFELLSYTRTVSNPRFESVEIYGQPTANITTGDEVAQRIAELFSTNAITGVLATNKMLSQAFAESSMVHIQTHGVHDAEEPLSSYLQLAGEDKYFASELLEHPIKSKLITLGACESASVAVELGDEPLGLMPALIQAGVKCVVAAMWRVHENTAAVFMRGFYSEMLTGKTAVDAYRHTVLSLMQHPEHQTPYHWAAFTVHGDPLTKIEVKESV